MLPRIGVMKALNRHVERVFNPERKDTHRGKLKRGGVDLSPGNSNLILSRPGD
jgi:hypothetical protein